MRRVSKELSSRLYFISSLACCDGRFAVVGDRQMAGLLQCFHQGRQAGVVAERLADVREPVYISWSENKAAAELKRICAQLMLHMARCARPPPCFRIIASQEMQDISGLQLRRAIGLPLLIDQERKGDAGLFAKFACIDPVSQADCSQCSSFVAKSLCVFAQLRGMLAAEDSSIVAQENNDSRLFVPQ